MQHSRWTLLPSALLWVACLAVYCVPPYARAMPYPNAPAQQSQTQIYLPLVTNTRTFIITGSLQAAADAAKPGDTLVLRNGVADGDLTIRRAGTASAPITLLGAGTGQSIIHGAVRVNGAAAFWRIQNLDVNANGEQDAIRIEAPAHHISLQGLHLYGGRGYGLRIGNDTSHVLIEDSEIDHFDAGDSDAHGVGIMTASDVVIRRCAIHHNSGDAIQSNTPDYPGYGRFASTILVEHSQLHDNRENALDVKSTHGLTFRDNQLWGFRAVESSDGMAIQVQHDAQHIVIMGNQIWDAVEGIEVSQGEKGGTPYPTAPHDVLIAGNLLHDLVTDPAGDSGNGSGIIIRTSTLVRVYNNTVLRAAGSGLYLSVSSVGLHPTDVDIRNNVFDGQSNDLRFAQLPNTVAGLIVDYNHYVSGRVDSATLEVWLAKSYERHATTGNPQLDAHLLPRDDSPLHDSGIDVGLPFTGDRPDRGWGESP
ncbi:MAG: nitrous oxide reductase family maturation protein NosD [Roseiflexaceae bacterium]